MSTEAVLEETAPFDARFPNMNQTKHCYQHYVDFYRCQKKLGEGAHKCQYFKKVFSELCPTAWVSQ